jgi:O-antigen ligase
LVAAAILVALVVGVTAGGHLKDRFFAISGEDLNSGMEVSAHGSYEQRRFLIIKSLDGIVHYPLGIGLGNFPSYSGQWREVHVAYLQIAVEGGFAAFVLYLLFFGRGFSNLRQLRRMGGNDEPTELFISALHSSLIGFGVGALFAPEAYQYFPYFAVAYTSVLLAIAKEKEPVAKEAGEPAQGQLRQKIYGRTR